MKKISVGRESFAKFIENDNYYVDKTLFIKETFQKDQSEVLLITRPRRFGKTLTLTMSTFHEFLRIDPNNPDNPEDTSYQERLFKDTEIFEDKEFCRGYMGKFPVIFVSLKNVDGGSFIKAYEWLASTVYDLASNFRYLQENKNGIMAVIEIKQIADKKASRTAAAERAIKQIADKRYAESEINNRDIKRIYAFGICFCRKYCSVVCERLK